MYVTHLSRSQNVYTISRLQTFALLAKEEFLFCISNPLAAQLAHTALSTPWQGGAGKQNWSHSSELKTETQT